ncbi:MAG: hypothetical protein HY608_07605 [Planctomycetes bacterium]|nr:hypothetical protein [Planctomycetota bacterium]
MFERRPAGGIGRDLVVCAGCQGRFFFYYQVGDTEPVRRPCPKCSEPVTVPGFRSWEKDGPPPGAKEPDGEDDDAEDDSQANWE